MKTKKQKSNNNNVHTNTSNNKQNKIVENLPSLGKQFELLYRTCDRQPSFQQYQSVFFLKRKKISENQASISQDKSCNKKIKNSKKKKIEEKICVDQVCDSFEKKNNIFSVTKSTMPSSTMGMFKKSSFAQTFKEKLDLDKSSIKKVNNLSNSNSSRYLSSKYNIKQQKSPKNKIKSPSAKQAHKSPNKNISNSNSNLQNYNNSNKSIDQKIKNINKIKSTKNKKNTQKSKSVNKPKNLQVKNLKQSQDQYVFVDGQYVTNQNPAFQVLAQVFSMYKAQSQKINSSNQFIQAFSKQKIKKQNQSEKSFSKEQLQQYQQQESITQSQKIQAQKQIISKIVFIQRWWRSIIPRKTILNCNNIKHYPSSAQSQRSLSEKDSNIQQPNFQKKQRVQVNKEENGVQNFILMREKLILSHMQSEKQILDKMLILNKIGKLEYSENLAQIQSNFQKQMLQICKLKKKIQAQTQRAQQLKLKIKQKSQIIQKLQKIPTNVILQHFLEKPKNPPTSYKQIQNQDVDSNKFQRQKSTGYHYSQLNEQKFEISNKVISYRKTANDNQNQNDNEDSNKNQNDESENDQNDQAAIMIKSPLDFQKQKFGSSQQGQQREEQQNEEDDENGEITFQHQKFQQMFSMFADKQLAQSQIEKRYAYQLGISNQIYESCSFSISTSVISIHNFLLNFLKFYEYFYKDEFLKLINLPYGYNQGSRLKIIQKYTPDNYKKKSTSENQNEQTFFRIQSIISEQILEDFHQHNYQIPQNVDDATKAMIYFEKIHHKAIIDCFNESLNCFRPYYFIDGAPYSWNYSEKALTFYYIAQQNIQEVLKTASCLCGAIAQPLISKPQITQEMTLEQKFTKYRESVSITLSQNRQQKLGKVQKQETQQQNFRWQYFEQDKTSILYSVAEQIYLDLLQQLLDVRPFGQNEQPCYINIQSSKLTTTKDSSSNFSQIQQKQQSQQSQGNQSSHSLQKQSQNNSKQQSKQRVQSQNDNQQVNQQQQHNQQQQQQQQQQKREQQGSEQQEYYEQNEENQEFEEEQSQNNQQNQQQNQNQQQYQNQQQDN